MKGCSQTINLFGMGYRILQSNFFFFFKIGLSHKIFFTPQNNNHVKLLNRTRFKIFLRNSMQLYLLSFLFKKLKKPSIFKKKGLFYKNESVVLKNIIKKSKA